MSTTSASADTGLPQPLRDLLFQEIPAGKDWRDDWDHYLSFDGALRTEERSMLGCFLRALDHDGIDVHATSCEDEPYEIVVRARGTDADGIYLADLNILLLGPDCYDGSGAMQALADAVVDRWDDLRTLHRTLKAEGEASTPGLG